MAKKIYGAGSITKLENGKWKWRGHYYDETTGKERRPSKTFNTKKEAENFRESVYKNDYLKSIKKPKKTVEEAYKKWQNELWKVDGYYSENTKRGWVGVFSKHIIPLIGKDELQKINTDKIQKYYNKLKSEGITKKTIKNINQALDALLKFCIIKKMIDKNPLNEIIIPRENMKRRAEQTQFKDGITEKEYTLVKEHFTGIFQYALLFIAESGIRPEEILLRHEDVDYENQKIYIARAVKRELIDYESKKTKLVESEDLKSIKAYRTIPMTASLNMILEWQEEMLEKMKIKSPYVFPNTLGKMIELRNLLRSFHSACKKAGIEKRGVRSLRKLYITRRIKEGMKPKNLQHLVGHESITTTLSFYQILDEEDIRNEAMKSDLSILGLKSPEDFADEFYEEYYDDELYPTLTNKIIA